MISPYFLRHATTEATADRIQYFLRDYFNICQRQLPADKRSVLMSHDLIWDFEDNMCFPLFIRRGLGFCDMVRDPLAPPQGTTFSEAQFLTEAEDRRHLLRLERPLHPFALKEKVSLSKDVLCALNGWLEQLDLTKSTYCAAVQIQQGGMYGIADPCGKILVPALYHSIVPFSLRTQEISLFVCYKDEPFTNTVDVYDVNGNQIYADIGGFYLHTEQVKYAFSGNDGNAPCARYAEKVQVIQYRATATDGEVPPYTAYVRDVNNMRLLPVADEDDGPRRISRFSNDVRYARNVETIDLRDIHDVLYPLAEVVGAYFGNTAEEIMLSIPHWNLFRLGHTRFEGVVPHLPLHLLLDLPENIRTVFESFGFKEVEDVANADFSNLRIEDRSLESAVFLAQMQIQYALAHPAEEGEE